MILRLVGTFGKNIAVGKMWAGLEALRAAREMFSKGSVSVQSHLCPSILLVD